MRKYPKKCPACGEYMEPIFEEDEIPIRTRLGGTVFSNPNQEPTGWVCPECGKKTEEGEGVKK